MAGLAKSYICFYIPWQVSWFWVVRLAVVCTYVTPLFFWLFQLAVCLLFCCVLGSALGARLPHKCAWQAWNNLVTTFVSGGRRGCAHQSWFFAWLAVLALVALMVLGGALGSGLGGHDAVPFFLAGVVQICIHYFSHGKRKHGFCGGGPKGA